MNNIDTDDLVVYCILCFVISAVVVFYTMLFSNKEVTCYYPKVNFNSGSMIYSIYGDFNWAVDEPAYASLNKDDMLDVYSKLTPHCGRGK